MNWTGGRLSRHSGTSNPVKDRQKQHFAKVQQALRSGPKKHSPIKWSIFDHVSEDREQRQREASAVKHRTPQAYDQRESQPNRQHHGHLSSSRILAQQNGSRHSSRSQELSNSRPVLVPVKQQPSRVPDDDLYNTTPPPREAKRKREDSTAISEMENLADQEEEESLSEKRRKILRKGDWVGVSIQRPPQVAFASPRKEENIGRRRKITDAHRARYSSKQLHITSPFPTRRPVLVCQRSSQEGPQERQHPRTDVRISIGGRVVPPGVSSSSAPRRMGSHSTIAHRRSQTTSSDVMLLDTNASAMQESPRMATSNLAAVRYSTSGDHIDLHSQDLSPNAMSLERGGGQAKNIPYEAEDSGNGWAGIFSDTASEVQQKHQELVHNRDTVERFPKTHHNKTTPAPENNNPNPGRLVFSSSTTSIHHPAPQSSRVSVLLRSASSDIAESTMAQVGRNKPVIPSSQILENEIWETWIAPEQKYDHSSDYSDFNEHGNVQCVSISPGVSTSRAPWHGSSEGDDIEDERSFELQGSDSEEPPTSSEKSRVPVSRISDDLTPSSPELTRLESEGVADGAGKAGRTFSAADEELHKAIPPVFPDNPFIEENQNESWTKFLFGGISEELDASIPTPKRTAAPSHKPDLFGTSVLGQASGDRSAVSDARLRNTTTPAAPSSISRTSRITEASPCPSGSRYEVLQLEMASTADSPPWNGGISVQAEKGSIIASSSDSFSASVAVQPTSQYSTSEVVETVSLYRPQRKITFTRPKPFIGRKANLDPIDQSEPLYIGQGLMEEDESAGIGRKRKRKMRYFAGSCEQDEQDEQEDVESIEDD